MSLPELGPPNLFREMPLELGLFEHASESPTTPDRKGLPRGSATQFGRQCSRHAKIVGWHPLPDNIKHITFGAHQLRVSGDPSRSHGPSLFFISGWLLLPKLTVDEGRAQTAGFLSECRLLQIPAAAVIGLLRLRPEASPSLIRCRGDAARLQINVFRCVGSASLCHPHTAHARGSRPMSIRALHTYTVFYSIHRIDFFLPPE